MVIIILLSKTTFLKSFFQLFIQLEIIIKDKLIINWLNKTLLKWIIDKDSLFIMGITSKLKIRIGLISD